MAASDTWLKEFEESTRLADDISGRLKERDAISSSGGDPSHLVNSTRRKITQLGTCLDRLESLLQNPPEKPRLNEEEVYRRQEMLLGIRFKTNQLASSFSTSPSNRTNLYSIAEDSVKRSVEPVSESIVTLLPPKQATITRHQPVTDATEDSSLQTHLLQSERETPRVLLKGDEHTDSSKGCSSQLICLIILGVVVLLLLVWTILRIW